MTATWKISDEATKALDVTKITPKSSGIPNSNIRLASLETDRMTFSQVFDSYSDVSGPELGQVVELWRDVPRFFKGHCTGRRVRDTTSGGLQIDTLIGLGGLALILRRRN